MRTSEIIRNTNETKISLSLNIDGTGVSQINSGCGFLDHMLTLFARHGSFDLNVSCCGDTEVDYHHTVEDIGIALGQALNEALGDKRGITRYGFFVLPMDEVLMLCAIDISGRAHLGYQVEFDSPTIGDFDTELVKEFMLGFVRNCPMSLHFKEFSGENAHHLAEGMFKALGRALSIAVSIDERHKDEIPSTKGVL
ncbi:MAG: imidazoleglycerol-phosphate dehydratase HisB [Clostridia bacterium]|nr:imidazoleglycerol-phosphate dehydratase HisB [Clostridia bacterium]